MGIKRTIRIKFKVILLLLGICFLGIISYISRKTEHIVIPQEERMKVETVQIQLKALFEDFESSNLNEGLEAKRKEDLTNEDLGLIIDYLQEEKGFQRSGEFRKGDVVSKTEWRSVFDELLEKYDVDNTIQKVETVVFGLPEMVTGNDETKLAPNQVLTKDGIVSYQEEELTKHLYQTIMVYQKQGELLTYEGVGITEFVWENSWLVEAGNQNIIALCGTWFVKIPYDLATETMREQLADIHFKEGKVSNVTIKSDKITGKLLAFSEKTIEIEGQGVFSLNQNARVFRLYERAEELNRKDLTIGLEYADFVIEDQQIVGCLITRKEALETIRVLLKTSDFKDNYHSKVVFCADTELTIRTGEETIVKKAGEEISIDLESDLFKESRIKITPSALTGKTSLLTIQRSQGNPSYRGSFELEKTEKGLLVINELLLEEYLYAVVPSEMPATYPKEALKAQAICARTYAYRNLNNADMAALGANVDDSVAYQVYNNIIENKETTAAVNETQGKVILYEGALAGTYYYSTSCGYGSTIEVWNGNNANDFPYLTSKRLGESVSGNEVENAVSLSEEAVFSDFINQTFPTDWESEEGWYRWKYEVNELNIDSLEERIKERYPEQRGSLGNIKNISIQKRNQGGVAEELLIEGTKNSVLIQKEYNIRYVLSDRSSDILKQNGEIIPVGTLLPSAYIVITPQTKDGYVTGYQVTGGGYGHGVGMSQNGAKGMALQGYDSNQIIEFFYEGAVVENR